MIFQSLNQDVQTRLNLVVWTRQGNNQGSFVFPDCDPDAILDMSSRTYFKMADIRCCGLWIQGCNCFNGVVLVFRANSAGDMI